jgi:hypothetical protein
MLLRAVPQARVAQHLGMRLDDFGGADTHALDHAAGEGLQLPLGGLHRVVKALDFPFRLIGSDAIFADFQFVALDQVTAADRDSPRHTMPGQSQGHGISPGKAFRGGRARLLMFTKTLPDEIRNGGDCLPLIDTVRFDHQLRSGGGGQRQHTHDRFGIHRAGSLDDLDIGTEGRGTVDQPGSRAGMQAEFVDDGDGRRNHS